MHVVPLPTLAPTANPDHDLDSVFREWAPYVAAIGLKMLGRKADVDDLVQDVFLAAHRGLAQIREPLALKGWLATVTVRLAARHLRRRRLRQWLSFDPSVDYGSQVARHAPYEERALLAQVYAVLDQLPVQQRLAWTLRHIQGESLADVSRLLRCSLATAKRKIAHAQAVIAEAVCHG